MNLIKQWNEYMGPKDERLVAEGNRFAKIGFVILLIGSVVCCYYSIMLEQVSDVTDTPIYTAVGERVFDPAMLLFICILIACFVSSYLETKHGVVSSRTRLATVESIPWEYVALLSVATGAVICALSVGLRIVAEIPIVGLDEVRWLGDLAIGVVYFTLGFMVAFGAFALQFHSAIKRRRELEGDLDE